MSIQILSAEFAAAANSLASLPAPLWPEVAFAGRSNVGKSTLLGALSERKKLARVSKDPGRTRALVLFDVRARRQRGAEPGQLPPPPEDLQLRWVDLPGYGYAKISKREAEAWQPLIEGYLRERSSLRVVLLLIDIRRGPQQQELDMLQFVDQLEQGARSKKVSSIVVATKLDKLALHERKPKLRELRLQLGVPVFGVAAEQGDGLDALLKAIVEAAL